MMKQAITSALFLFAFLSLAQSQLTWDWGRCPKVTVKSDFDVNLYLGTWYEIARYPNFFESADARCIQAVYGPSEKGSNYVTVTNSGLLPDGTTEGAVGEAWVPDPAEPGKLLVRFSRFSPAGDYWVLATDYDRYSLVHSCTDFFIFHTQIDWILSQHRQLDQSTLEEVNGIFEANDVFTEPLVFTDQEGCDGNSGEPGQGPQ